MATSAEPASGHALFLPYPAQGHVIPFMELAHRFLDRGFAVTFVNTKFNHRRVVAAAGGATTTYTSAAGGRLRLVAVDDGIDDDDGDHENLILLNAAMQEAIPPQLETLLDGEDATGEGLGKVTCVVVDSGMSWSLDVVKRRGLPSAALWAASAAVLSVLVNAKKLIRDGVIDDDGAPVNLKNNSFHLNESATSMDATFLAWNYMGNRDAERLVFHYLTSTAQVAAAKADFLLCNTFSDIEPAVFSGPTPATILPIGPLRTWQRPTRHAPVGHFWHADDAVCMSFLDAQPGGSVVYVAFGSISVMTVAQLRELALGLETSGRPFLWVVRPEQAGKLPAGFADAIDGLGKGKVVGWAPQEQVLGHPAVGCFVTHCGWNSTLEGIRNGLPMLCWPYFTDQFTNQTYICDIWRVGLRVASADGGGLVMKEKVVELLDRIFKDEGAKERMLRLKEMAEKNMSEEGQSLNNMNVLMESMGR
ncbi:Cytokinin-O-glucosyltransferase 2 [Hordeum vulgare]|uniref:Glycosyltransferase n=2 Tax=Hordeum vulgare subsp. vulgare TaxID=112509 RepID=A0A8I6XJC0_HORVV|nr:UDP-glycosyltransferase 83A1-like [Hordeum vulgare subsp. vulgare]KAE8798928.1 Cytokinin-O-glucosyltransferase 2 [Hordeum vulgare]